MLKLVTIVGTRPEIIRLSRIIPHLDKYFSHTLVHTGQNYDVELNEIFFKELQIKKPDYFLNINPRLIIIEDISHSQGAKIDNNPTGSMCLASFMSMQGDKAINMHGVTRKKVRTADKKRRAQWNRVDDDSINRCHSGNW